jgi:hypothetical protein
MTRSNSAGDCEQRFDRAEPRFDPRKRLTRSRVVRHIERRCLRTDRVSSFMVGIDVDVGDDDPPTALDEYPRGGQSDSARASGDHRNAATSFVSFHVYL